MHCRQHDYGLQGAVSTAPHSIVVHERGDPAIENDLVHRCGGEFCVPGIQRDLVYMAGSNFPLANHAKRATNERSPFTQNVAVSSHTIMAR